MVNRKKINMEDFFFQMGERIKEQSRLPNIRKYEPHEKQFKFHSSFKKRKLYIGGNRSGKTTGGVCEGVWRATGTHPYRPELNLQLPNRGRVVGVDFTQGIDKIILPQYKQWTPASELLGGTWDKAYDRGGRVLNFKNGSTIEFMSYDQDLDKFAGTSRHWVHFDEEVPRPIWVECLARLVDTNGEWWLTMTPVEGMNWIYDDVYEKNVNNPDGTIEVIEINTLENPYLTAEGIKGLMDVIDADDTTARIGGNFVTVGGRIYKNFDPTPGSLQVLSEPIDEPAKMFDERNWLWIMGLDHGLNNPTAVLWMAVDPNGFCVVFDEYYHAERTIDQNAKGIKEIIARHGRFPDLLVADPTIKNRQAISATSIQEEYQRAGLSFTLGNNDVKAGIVRVKKYLNTHKYVSTPRNRPEFFGGPKPGTELDLFKLPEGSDEFPRLRITPNCQKLIWEMKRYRWATYTNKKLAFERNAYEEPNKKDDHACDTLRYMIMTRPDLVGNNSSLNAESAKEVMNRLGQELTLSGNGNFAFDDPNGITDNPEWQPSVHGTPSSEGAWEFDEHMGGMY